MKLVLQCAMCGTHHPVDTPACTTCRASGVTQLRLMFECPICGNLGINPICKSCPFIEPLELDDDLIVAEEVIDATEDDLEDFDLDLDAEDTEDEAVVVDLSEENFDDSDLDEDESDEDFDAFDEEEDEGEGEEEAD